MWQKAELEIFNQKAQSITFQYRFCDDKSSLERVYYKTDGVDFNVFASFAFDMPEEALRVNPQVAKTLRVDAPLLKISKLGPYTPQSYLKSMESFRPINWDICEIQRMNQYVWALKNSAYQDVETYDLSGKSADEMLVYSRDYKKRTADQRLLNQACGNLQHNWYGFKGGIVIVIPAPNATQNIIDPSSIVYKNTG